MSPFTLRASLRPAALALVAGLALPAGASASDASIRAVVREQSAALTREARDVARAAQAGDADVSDADITRFQAQLDDVRTQARSFRRALRAERASTATVDRGRDLMVAGLGNFDRGFARLDAALETVKDDGSPEKAQADLDASVRLLARGTRQGTQGERLIFTRRASFTG